MMMERSDPAIRRSTFDVQRSMFDVKKLFVWLVSRRIGPNRFGSLGQSPSFK
jgi:hypothetical protein